MSNEDKFREMKNKLEGILGDIDEFVESRSDDDIADLLHKLRNQALKNLIHDTYPNLSPDRKDIDVLIAVQSFEISKKVKYYTKILIFLTAVLIFFTGALIYLTFKII